MSKNQISIALMGYGTVGSSVYQLLESKAPEITQATGVGISIKKILVRDVTLPRSGAPQEIFTENFEDILEDDTIPLVVELIGGLEPAFDLVTSLLEKGRTVVTANKQLLSQQGAYLFRLAEEKGTRIKFEASVAGAVPVIKVLRESMVAAGLTGIFGIVNGTTNFILTEMSRTGARYEDALARAQEWGYAEADPTEDINGKDAAAKMAILASIAFHTPVALSDVTCSGIENITALDIAYAHELGFTIKLLGVARLYDSRINVRVYPALVAHDHPVASVNGAYNAVFLTGSSIHEIMLSGPGAGGIETASAVVSDIVQALTRPDAVRSENPIPFRNLEFFTDEEVVSTFYLRLEVQDEPGVLAAVSQVFGQNGVSVESVIQKGRGAHAELVMIFHPVEEKRFMTALAEITQLPVVKGTPRPLRVEGKDHER